MNSCRRYQCPECGDRLIHQLNRGVDESSSAFGQYIHDKVKHEFDFVDLDGITWRRSTRVLTFWEEKHGGRLSRSQEAIFPILERMTELAIADGIIDARSRVLEVHAEWERVAGELDLQRAMLLPHPPVLGRFPVLKPSDLSDLLRGRKFYEDFLAAP